VKIAAIITFALASAFLLAQQPEPRSVWDGVYSRAQADRGRARYESACAECHGDDLEGDVVEHPELAGGNFRDKWNGLKLDELFQRIQRDMPPNKAGSLSRPAAADLVAFILSANQFPEGAAELSTDPKALAQIRIDARKPGEK
jgi:mono/diheme cytochrome c family protein